jgi:phage tail-like protein
MARARYTDYFAINKFQLLDVSFSLPPVLVPLFGFRSCSFPQISLTYRQIKEGNYEYPRYATVERAEVTPIVLEQGVSLINSDFWDWVRKAVTSTVTKRNLLLIQFTNINPLAEALVTGSTLNKVPGASGAGGSLGLFEDGARIPGKAWMLYNCRALSYKPGTDLDAMSGEISLATLEIQPEEIEEISIGI